MSADTERVCTEIFSIMERYFDIFINEIATKDDPEDFEPGGKSHCMYLSRF